jgi:hypothetical protein
VAVVDTPETQGNLENQAYQAIQLTAAGVAGVDLAAGVASAENQVGVDLADGVAHQELAA